jgi:hypothetical protein
MSRPVSKLSVPNWVALNSAAFWQSPTGKCSRLTRYEIAFCAGCTGEQHLLHLRGSQQRLARYGDRSLDAVPTAERVQLIGVARPSHLCLDTGPGEQALQEPRPIAERVVHVVPRQRGDIVEELAEGGLIRGRLQMGQDDELC